VLANNKSPDNKLCRGMSENAIFLFVLEFTDKRQ
jgi:hypothetical protein